MNERIGRGKLTGSRSIETIPVVFHVIYHDQPIQIGTNEINTAIEHLNAAFSNTGSYFDTNGVDTQIQFCKAAQDPNGVSSTGWTTSLSPLANMTAELDDESLKQIDMWDPTSYINVWVVESISSLSMGEGMAGYAYFPAAHGTPIDGIVVEAAYFGNSIDNDKVLIHEVGHYFGLYHTFEGGCINADCTTDGDRVCDTPPDNSTAPVACSETPNTCTTDEDDTSDNNPFRSADLGGLGDQPDMIQNYMDYGYQACQTAFTLGQSNRMNLALTEVRNSLLDSEGCEEPCPTWISQIEIIGGSPEIAFGTELNFSANGNLIDTYTWHLNDALISTASQWSYTFNEIGLYTVTLETTYAGTSCHRFATYVLRVLCDATASFVGVADNSFEVNSTVAFDNTSANANTYLWVLDGSVNSADENWSQYFEAAGSHRLMLVASSLNCADTSNTYYFEIGDCDFSGINANWILGSNQVHFEEDGNVVVTTIPNDLNMNLEGRECASTISDIDGNLLFYTNGEVVWDQNHSPMPNGEGLLANYSSTQATLIVPHPGNPNQYFLFTNDAVENNFLTGIHYSIIDMTLHNGMGDIVDGYKNIWLIDGMSEKLTATWHANGKDIWLLAAESTGNRFYAWLIDGNGIQPSPVISQLGGEATQGLGSMAVSHDGNRIATFLITEWPWQMMLADFDKSTGVLSNAMGMELSSEFNQQIFGIEFSPDNSKLYCSMIQGGAVLQYDLTYSTASEINASKYSIALDYAWAGHVNIGRDDKVYLCNRFYNTIDVIENPNLQGAACNFVTPNSALVTQGYYSQYVSNIIEGFNAPHQANIAGPSQVCVGGNVYQYGIQYLHDDDMTTWTHSGPSAFEVSVDGHFVELQTTDNVSADTLYVEITGGCGTVYDTLMVYTNLPQDYVPFEDQVFCGDSITFSISNEYYYHQWNDGSSDLNYVVNGIGDYSVELHDLNGCVIIDQFAVVSPMSYPSLDLGDDQTICQGGIAVLESNHEYPHYHWHDMSMDNSTTVYGPGVYWLTVSDACGIIDSDTIQVQLSTLVLDLNYNGNDTICSEELPITLTAPLGYSSYLWNQNEGGNVIAVNSVGTTTLTATTDEGCYASDSFVVEVCEAVAEGQHEGVHLYPNPAHEGLFVEWGEFHGHIAGVFDARGRLIHCNLIPQSNGYWIDVHPLAAGVYILRMEDATKTYTIPFTKD